MLELAILYFLKKQKTSLYGLKKNLTDKFPHLYSTSMGAIHPIIKKFETEEILKQKIVLTKGGLRKSNITLTKKGEELFQKLMMEDFDCSLNQLDLFVSCKIAFSDELPLEFQKTLFTKIIRQLEDKNQVLQKLMKKQKFNEIQLSQLEFLSQQTFNYTKWLQKKL